MTSKYDYEIIEYLKKLGFPLLYILPNQYDELCMEAVKQKYYACNAMQAVKNQTDKICLAAVNNDGMALQFVKKQTHEICIAAVCQNGLALQFVKNPTYEIYMAAVNQNGIALQFVKDDNPDIYFAKYKNIKNDIDKNENFYCSICLTENTDELCQIITCFHSFHKKCLLQWIKQKNNCPHCRIDIN